MDVRVLVPASSCNNGSHPGRPLKHPEAVHSQKKHVAITIDVRPLRPSPVGVDETVSVGLRIELAEPRRRATARRIAALEILLADGLDGVDRRRAAESRPGIVEAGAIRCPALSKRSPDRPGRASDDTSPSMRGKIAG